MSKFTPGPWVWVGDTLESAHERNAGGYPIDVVETDSGVYPPYGADRNLIAAAPEMYELLLRIVNNGRASNEDLADAQSILSKVEGQ